MIVPHRSRRLLLISLAYLGVVTLWVGPEDSVWAAAILGAVGALLAVLNVVTLRLGGRALGRAQWMALATLGGALTGAAASGIAALLMVIKTAVHAHGPFTDYPATVIAGILRRGPLWAAAGLLIGTAVGLAGLAVRKSK